MNTRELEKSFAAALAGCAGGADVSASELVGVILREAALHRVSDVHYQRALDAFGVKGVVELTALVGYYSMVVMTLNAHDIPVPPGATPPASGSARAPPPAPTSCAWRRTCARRWSRPSSTS